MPRNRSLPQVQPLEQRLLMSKTRHPVLHGAIAGTGLTAEYFGDSNLTQGVVVRTDPTINFAPTAAAGKALKSAGGSRWAGTLNAPATGDYFFTIKSNGGVRLWVAGQLVIDASSLKGGKFRSTAITLTAGQQYPIRLEYSKAPGKSASIGLTWATAKSKSQVVAQSSLYPDNAATLPAVQSALIG